MKINEFLDAARAGIVTVTFKKINSEEIRVMPCTLNSDILKENGIEISIDKISDDSDHLVCFAMDKKAWRSFRVNTVIEWSMGEPEEKVSDKGSDS
jgi:hypothetical protein